MNNHIKFVKEWLADNECKTEKELDDNFNDAYDASDSLSLDASNYDLFYACDASYWAMKGDAEKAAEYIERYEELAQEEG